MSFKKLILSLLAINGFSLSAMEPNPLHISNAQSYLDLLTNDLSCELTKFSCFKRDPVRTFWLAKDRKYHKDDKGFIVPDSYASVIGNNYLALLKKTSDSKNKIEIWDIARKEPVRSLEKIEPLEVLTHNDHFLIHYNNHATVYDIENNQEILLRNNIKELHGFWSNDRYHVIHVTFDNQEADDKKGTILVFDHKVKLLSEFKNIETHAKYSSVNDALTRFATLTEANDIQIRDLTNGQLIKTIQLPFNRKDMGAGLCLSSDGNKLACSDKNENQIYLWDMQKDTPSCIEDCPEDATADLRFSNDDGKLFCCSIHNFKSVFDCNALKWLMNKLDAKGKNRVFGLPGVLADDTSFYAVKYANNNFLDIFHIIDNYQKKSFCEIPFAYCQRFEKVYFVAHNTKLITQCFVMGTKIVAKRAQPFQETQLTIHNLVDQEIDDHLNNKLSFKAVQLLKEAHECYKEKLVLDLTVDKKGQTFESLPLRLKKTICDTIEVKKNLKRLAQE